MAAEKIALYNLAGKPFSLPSPPVSLRVACNPRLLTQRAPVHPDLKNTSDDAIPNYLNSLKFTQSHFLQDVRLALGYGAFSVAALCFLWDYKLGWDSTKHFTAAAVALYMLLNAALTFWTSQKEKNVIYQGTAPSGDKVRLGAQHQLNAMAPPPAG